MEDKILLGRGRAIVDFPAAAWKQHLAHAPLHAQSRLKFMTEDHQRVRYFVVEALARRQRPIEPGAIAAALDLPPERVGAILDELERKLFFLVRNESGAVAWAYPVTVEPTPHQITFASGERLYGA